MSGHFKHCRNSEWQHWTKVWKASHSQSTSTKSASFTVSVVLCETKLHKWAKRTFGESVLKDVQPEKLRFERHVVCRRERTMTLSEKGLISTLFEAYRSFKSWELITSHEITQRIIRSVTIWVFSSVTSWCNIRSLFSIYDTLLERVWATGSDWQDPRASGEICFQLCRVWNIYCFPDRWGSCQGIHKLAVSYCQTSQSLPPPPNTHTLCLEASY